MPKACLRQNPSRLYKAFPEKMGSGLDRTSVSKKGGFYHLERIRVKFSKMFFENILKQPWKES
jgi:hypothetical protein